MRSCCHAVKWQGKTNTPAYQLPNLVSFLLQSSYELKNKVFNLCSVSALLLMSPVHEITRWNRFKRIFLQLHTLLPHAAHLTVTTLYSFLIGCALICFFSRRSDQWWVGSNWVKSDIWLTRSDWIDINPAKINRASLTSHSISVVSFILPIYPKQRTDQRQIMLFFPGPYPKKICLFLCTHIDAYGFLNKLWLLKNKKWW